MEKPEELNAKLTLSLSGQADGTRIVLETLIVTLCKSSPGLSKQLLKDIEGAAAVALENGSVPESRPDQRDRFLKTIDHYQKLISMF